jgi:hypothetical protein
MDASQLAARFFTRVETFGSPDVHWVRGTVAEKNPEVFSFTPEIVDANR